MGGFRTGAAARTRCSHERLLRTGDRWNTLSRTRRDHRAAASAMTTTRQHIEDLDLNEWARLTRRAAAESVETSTRLGLRPRPETVALAAMTEGELVEHRERNGPAKKRPSPVMQLVEADQRSREAQSRARAAHQAQLDAEAAAAMARTDADESAHAATAARERVRAVQTESAEKDRRRARERAADQQAVQLARAETEQVRADAAGEVAAAHERVRAAEARAEQRATERTAERSTGERTLQELQSQLDKVRADAAAEVAAARERASAAEARAEQRVAERAAERAAGEEAVARLHGEVERVRADAAAEVAAVRGQASGEVAAIRQAAATEVATAQRAAQSEVDDVRRAAQADIDAAHTYADDVLRQSQAEAARVMSAAPESRLLTIPIAPVEVRAQIRPIEVVLDALYQIDYALETGMAESQPPPDVEFVRSLTWTVQERAKDLSSELANLPARFTDQSDVDAAASYANAAGSAYSAFLQRIEQATQRLKGRNEGRDREIIEAVSAMVADPWIQALRQPLVE
jgi:colicin import membrane protein